MSDSSETSAAAESKPVLLHVVQISDVGLVRSENQDFAITSAPDADMTTEGKGRLMIVADGMGGHRGGATASRLAAMTIKEAWENNDTPDLGSALRDAMEQANTAIWSEAQSNNDLRGMGTTCSVLVVRGREAFIAHVGDSRIYLIRRGEIRQLTEDHSLVASMVREGLITSKEAEVHPRRNVLQRSMGVGESLEVDVADSFFVQHGDTFILCSDGLHGLVKEDELRDISAQPIEQAAREFVRRAIERGAPDNVTVILARVEDPSEVGREPGDPHVLESEKTTAKMPAISDETVKVPSLRKWLLVALCVIAAGGALFYLRHAPPLLNP